MLALDLLCVCPNYPDVGQRLLSLNMLAKVNACDSGNRLTSYTHCSRPRHGFGLTLTPGEDGAPVRVAERA